MSLMRVLQGSGYLRRFPMGALQWQKSASSCFYFRVPHFYLARPSPRLYKASVRLITYFLRRLFRYQQDLP